MVSKVRTTLYAQYSFHLNGHTLRFHPQTQMLESPVVQQKVQPNNFHLKGHIQLGFSSADQRENSDKFFYDTLCFSQGVIFKTIRKRVYLRDGRITSSVLVTKIRKSPDISKPNGITNARHDEVGFCSPLFAFFAHIGAFTRRFSSGVNFVWHVLTLK